MMKLSFTVVQAHTEVVRFFIYHPVTSALPTQGHHYHWSRSSKGLYILQFLHITHVVLSDSHICLSLNVLKLDCFEEGFN